MLQTSNDYKLYLSNGSFRVVGPDSATTAGPFVAHLTKITSDVAIDGSETKLAASHGSLISSKWRGTRVVVLDLLVGANNTAEERAEAIIWLQQINGELADTEGASLVWTEADGWEKQISELRPASYLNPDNGEGPTKLLQLQLHTGDPFIRSTDTHIRTISGGSGSTKCFNGGNAPAFPVFYLYGPFTSATIENNATGGQLIYNGAVADGDYLRIDTDPRKRTVLYNGESNTYGNLDFATADFFHIPNFAVDYQTNWSTTGTTGANTKLEIRWRSAWE